MAESDVPAGGNNAANTSQPSATHPRRNSSTSNNTNNNNNNSPAADEAAAIIDRFFDMFVDLSAKAEKEPVEVSLKHQNDDANVALKQILAAGDPDAALVAYERVLQAQSRAFTRATATVACPMVAATGMYA
ncbi:hypothetical protein NKR19_g5321 [Coniochaeta hoffmannii]|uniref:Uncharacterized protein n=1 Tax=Coniochaeta hoffmannii TaxID=91930 RepID=A0AA38RK53_9PEZI|nr:hypothetical protein NKR19_g5321 [Coniochaeta hoffmannii]